MQKPMLVFQTDFTYKEGAVCAMYGVVKSVDRSLEIIDGTHELPQYDIWSASYRLYQSMRFWPQGTVFVSVVDPGVGTARKACVARTKDGYYIVTPDNGSLTHVLANNGIAEVREIDETINRLHGKGTDEVSVFHGRDLFGYCAARLAAGVISYAKVGPKYDVSEIVKLPIAEPALTKKGVEGIFEINDPNFGNLWTNIPTHMLLDAGFEYGKPVHLTVTHGKKKVFDHDVMFGKSFGFVKKGQPIIYNNELMKAALAVSQGSFADRYRIGYGSGWNVRFSKAK
jgi:S-adenosylmethionine hydrolase